MVNADYLIQLSKIAKALERIATCMEGSSVNTQESQMEQITKTLSPSEGCHHVDVSEVRSALSKLDNETAKNIFLSVEEEDCNRLSEVGPVQLAKIMEKANECLK